MTPASTSATSVAAGPTGAAGSANVTTVGAHMVHSEGTVASGPSRLRVHLLLGIVLAARLAGAAADEDPCTRPCGRGLTCSTHYGAFTCEDLSGLSCNCTGCCLASLAPLAPPAPPPSVPPPPSSPKPLLPPVPPGEAAVGTMDEIRDAIGNWSMRAPGRPPSPASPPAAPPGLPLPPSAPPAPLAPPPSDPPLPPPPELPPAPPLPPPPPLLPRPPLAPSIVASAGEGSLVLHLSGVYLFGGSPLVVRGVDVTLEGGAEGATLDAEEVRTAASVCRLHVASALAHARAPSRRCRGPLKSPTAASSCCDACT